jgi:hypothetical protein
MTAEEDWTYALKTLLVCDTLMLVTLVIHEQ